MLTKAILNGLYFSQLDRLFTPLTGGIGGIWMLHRVGNVRDREFDPNAHLAVSPEFLDAAILFAKQVGYRFVSMDELAEILKAGMSQGIEEKLISITLDDGYLDNLENAMPVFRRHETPFTVYISSGLTSGTHTLWWEDLEWVISGNKKISVQWPNGTSLYDTGTIEEKRAVYRETLLRLTTEVDEDQQREIMDRLCKNHNHDASAFAKAELMTWQQLKELSKDPLCTLGAHTVGHYALARLQDADRVKAEMVSSRDALSKRIRKPVDHFAYPYGYVAAASDREFEIAREVGFETAVTTRHGVLGQNDGKYLHALPRISLNGNFQSERYLRPLMSGIPTVLNNLADKKPSFFKKAG